MSKGKILILAVAGFAYSDGEVLDRLRVMLERSALDIDVELVSAREVSEKARFDNPSLILIGHRPLSPGSSKIMGGDVIQKLKADSKARHIPILLIEGLHDIESVAKEFGADSFLQVPTTSDEFVGKIRDLVQWGSA
jgi:response regulator RpfG family c-di-GMP phosphodiesterase